MKLFSDNLSVPFLLTDTITIEVSFERVHYNFCCFRILIPDIRKCPFVHDHKWIKSNRGAEWVGRREGSWVEVSAASQTGKWHYVFPLTMLWTMKPETNSQPLKQMWLTIHAWTKWHQDRSIVFFFGKRKCVESFHITLNMTSIANETEPCKEPLWREDRWRP